MVVHCVTLADVVHRCTILADSYLLISIGDVLELHRVSEVERMDFWLALVTVLRSGTGATGLIRTDQYVLCLFLTLGFLCGAQELLQSAVIEALLLEQVDQVHFFGEQGASSAPHFVFLTLFAAY